MLPSGPAVCRDHRDVVRHRPKLGELAVDDAVSTGGRQTLGTSAKATCPSTNEYRRREHPPAYTLSDPRTAPQRVACRRAMTALTAR